MVLLVRFASGLWTAHKVGTRADGFAAMALGDPYQKYHRRQGTTLRDSPPEATGRRGPSLNATAGSRRHP